MIQIEKAQCKIGIMPGRPVWTVVGFCGNLGNMDDAPNTLIRKLQKRGNSHALVIDKTMMEQLGIGPDSLLQLTVSAGCLVVKPAEVGLGPEKVEASLNKFRRDPGYKKMLENLAK